MPEENGNVVSMCWICGLESWPWGPWSLQAQHGLRLSWPQHSHADNKDLLCGRARLPPFACSHLSLTVEMVRCSNADTVRMRGLKCPEQTAHQWAAEGGNRTARFSWRLIRSKCPHQPWGSRCTVITALATGKTIWSKIWRIRISV